jgi:hypothetical protein
MNETRPYGQGVKQMKKSDLLLLILEMAAGVLMVFALKNINDKQSEKLNKESDARIAKQASMKSSLSKSSSSKDTSSSSISAKGTGTQSALSIPSVYQATTVNAPADVNSVAQQMEARTGVSADTWAKIIMRESGGNASIYNSQGYYGLFQLAPGYAGNGGDVQAQIDNAVYLYDNGGLSHWAETAY